ncbi:MAG: nickel insertion protein, partial [Latilactobacillus curvatus]|nr:nickel insertion protein [Latilactobacillus curvatus]
MRTLYLDAFSGISGDMFIGALLDLGVDFKQFETELAKLNVPGYHLHAERIAKSSIYGTDFDVRLPEAVHKDEGFIETTPAQHQHPHTHAAGHAHTHQHANGHTHSHGDDVRHLKDIEAIIDHSDLSDYVKTNAKQVFTEIAQSEAVVHDLPLS